MWKRTGHHVLSAGFSTITCPDKHTNYTLLSLCTLNSNAGLTLSCQAFLFLFLFAGEACIRLQQKAYWQMIPLSAAGGGKDDFKWEFKTARVLSGRNRTQTCRYLQPSYSQPCCSPLLYFHFFHYFISTFFHPLRDPKKPLVDELPHKTETDHSEIRDHVLFTALPLYLVFYYICGELRFWALGSSEKKKKVLRHHPTTCMLTDLYCKMFWI